MTPTVTLARFARRPVDPDDVPGTFRFLGIDFEDPAAVEVACPCGCGRLLYGEVLPPTEKHKTKWNEHPELPSIDQSVALFETPAFGSRPRVWADLIAGRWVWVSRRGEIGSAMQHVAVPDPRRWVARGPSEALCRLVEGLTVPRKAPEALQAAAG